MKSVAAFAFAGLLLATGSVHAQTTTTPAPGPSNAALAAPTPAEPASDFAIAYNVGVQSDYVFRGVSQTNSEPSVFGGIDLTYKSIVYAGIWTSNLNFKPFGDPHTSEEVDLYGGIRPTFADFNFDLGMQYYGYTGQAKGAPNVDYTEIYAKATHAFGPVTLGVGVYYSWGFTGETGDATYSELNAAYTITPKWSVSGAFGHQQIEKAASYSNWNAGVTYAMTDHLGIDVRYYDTDSHNLGNPYTSRVVGALKLVF